MCFPYFGDAAAVHCRKVLHAVNTLAPYYSSNPTRHRPALRASSTWRCITKFVQPNSKGKSSALANFGRPGTFVICVGLDCLRDAPPRGYDDDAHRDRYGAGVGDAVMVIVPLLLKVQ